MRRVPVCSPLGAAILVAAVLLGLPAAAHAATSVGGQITGDVTWTSAGSPYNLTADVQVRHDATLTIQPGVVVNGSGRHLEVWGKLRAVGTSASLVRMNDFRVVGYGTSEAPQELFDIEMRFCDVNGGSLQGEHAGMYGTWTLADSMVVGTRDVMFLWYPTSPVRIDRCVFLNAGKIGAGVSGPTVTVADSVFYRSEEVLNDKDAYVENFSAFAGSVIASGNTFMNTGVTALRYPIGFSPVNLVSRDNWWTTTTAGVIDGMVFDRNDDLKAAAYLTVTPWLTAPSPSAPATLPFATTASLLLGSPSGETTVLHATLRDAGARAVGREQIVLQRSLDRLTWSTAGTTQTDDSGDATFTVPSSAGGYYRVSFAGVAGVYGACTSPQATARFVVRLGGLDRYLTAIEVSKANFAAGSAPTVVLATGGNFPDALSASGLCGSYHAPLLLTRQTSLPSAVLSEIQRLGATQVLIVGGEAAVSAQVESVLRGAYTVTRFGGKDRYETAALVAREVQRHEGPAFTHRAFIARGDDFPDALAVSPLAYDGVVPVLLTRPPALPAVTAGMVDELQLGQAVIAGSTAAVSAGVEDALEHTRLGQSGVVRVGGKTRFETARDIANWGRTNGLGSWQLIGVATGRNFPDALGGGVAAGAGHGVLLLTEPTSLHPTAQSALSTNKPDIAQVQVYGGPPAVSAPAFDAIVQTVR